MVTTAVSNPVAAAMMRLRAARLLRVPRAAVMLFICSVESNKSRRGMGGLTEVVDCALCLCQQKRDRSMLEINRTPEVPRTK